MSNRLQKEGLVDCTYLPTVGKDWFRIPAENLSFGVIFQP